MTMVDNFVAQKMNFSKVKAFEHQLDDVMEIIDLAELKVKLKEIEQQFQQDPTEINKLRIAIIYHETALNLSFFAKTEFKGYAQMSFDHLTQLHNS